MSIYDKEEMKRIKWGTDEHHVWIDGRQFISLKRFADARKEYHQEVVESIKMAEAIAEENVHLRALLKEKLIEEGEQE